MPELPELRELTEWIPPLPGEAWWAVAAGILLLVLGRRLSWLSLAVVGFWLGISLAVRVMAQAPLWLQLGVSALLGLVCAALAIFLLRLAVGLSGFLLGGYGLVWVVDNAYLELGRWEWPVIVLGAVISGIVLSILFNGALVVLTSVVGAILLVEASGLVGPPSMVLFAALVVFGMAVQRRRPPPGRRRQLVAG